MITILQKEYDYYLFDFDLTLFDTAKPTSLSYKAAFAAIGIKYEEENLGLYLAEFLTDTFSRICEDKNRYEIFANAFYTESHKVMHEAEIYDDVMETLETLKKAKKKIAIVTNKDAKGVNIILKSHNIDESFFDDIVTCEMIENRKPAPDALLVCIRNLDSKNGRQGTAVYIGDALNDILAAQNAKIDSYLIDRDFSSNIANAVPIYSLKNIVEKFNKGA